MRITQEEAVSKILLEMTQFRMYDSNYEKEIRQYLMMAVNIGFNIGNRRGGAGKEKKIGKYDQYGICIQKYRSIKVAAKMHGISHSTLSNAIAGYRSRAAGYYWKHEKN